MALSYRYWATFRLKQNPTWQKRYTALGLAFDKVGSRFWQEPTSFVAFNSVQVLENVARILKPALDPNVDLLVLALSDTSSCCYIGTPDNAAVFKHHFPFAKKV